MLITWSTSIAINQGGVGTDYVNSSVIVNNNP